MKRRNLHREWVLRELDGGLDAARQAELERAIAEDPELAAFAARQRRLDGLLEGLAEPPVERVAVQASLERIRERIDRGRAPRPAAWRPLVAAAAALMVAALGYGLLRIAGGEPGSGELTTADAGPTAAQAQPDPDAPMAPGNSPEPSVVATPSLPTYLAGLGAVGSADLEGALEALLPIAADAWSIRREVERVLDDSPSTATMLGALRFLGAHGDRLSARAVEDLLDDPVAQREALDALVALGPDGWPGLAAALADAALFEPALEAWGRVRDPRAAGRLADACERMERVELARSDRAAALGTLADLGAAGLGELLERVHRGELPLDLALEAIEPRHAGDLAAAAADRATTATLIEFARVARAGDLAPRLAEAATDPRLATSALAALANLPGDGAGRALLELRRLGRPSVDAVDAALAARDDASGWSRLARSVRGDRELSASLAEVLLGDPTLDGSAALAELARSTELPSDLRLLALRAVDPADATSAAALRALLAECTPNDSRLAAAALVALTAGSDVEHVLTLLPARAALESELRSALQRDPTSGLVRLARELRPHLPLTAIDGDELP